MKNIYIKKEEEEEKENQVVSESKNNIYIFRCVMMTLIINFSCKL